LQATFIEVLIDSVEIDGTRKPHIISYMMSKKLRKYVQARHSMFERIYPISEAMARRMLQTGYKQPSRFGRWCPVRVRN
jgi:adenylate/nucleoside-diphosphate kinase